jgi:hypothetical protein
MIASAPPPIVEPPQRSDAALSQDVRTPIKKAFPEYSAEKQEIVDALLIYTTIMQCILHAARLAPFSLLGIANATGTVFLVIASIHRLYKDTMHATYAFLPFRVILWHSLTQYARIHASIYTSVVTVLQTLSSSQSPYWLNVSQVLNCTWIAYVFSKRLSSVLRHQGSAMRLARATMLLAIAILSLFYFTPTR